jgi:HAE1 family hydrophobic/amphiphilic exporter-1
METISFPPGYRYKFGGSTKNMAESFGYAISALVLAVVFIYMILASQFKSFLQPLALMTSLPLTLIGVVLALMMFRSTLSMFSIIGVVMLMGLVTKNAILLVDFAIRAREPGIDADGQPAARHGAQHEALLMAAKVRLRPILMTTLAMIFGMVPLAFALTEGSEQRAPMGQAVIGGVITSSLLTLVVVPVVYCYMDDLAQWLRRLWTCAGQREFRHCRVKLSSNRANIPPGVIKMNLEQARFNMIEQQIRPWNVSDPEVLRLAVARQT